MKISSFELEKRDLAVDELLIEIEIEEEDIPLNGTCPHADHCQVRRQRLPTYRQHQPCHWLAFGAWDGSWRRCPIFKDNKLMEKTA